MSMKLLNLVDDIVVLKRQLDLCSGEPEKTLRGGAVWEANRRETAILSLRGIIGDCNMGLAIEPDNQYFLANKQEALQKLIVLDPLSSASAESIEINGVNDGDSESHPVNP